MMRFSQSFNKELNFKTLFELTSGSCLVLAPDENFTIVAVNKAYLHDTKTKRENIIGKSLFEIFPDITETGTKNLPASLERVIQNKTPDTITVQKYGAARLEAKGKGFEERYWSLIKLLF